MISWLKSCFRNPRAAPHVVDGFEECVRLVKKWEGYRRNAYQCPSKKWTVGYGATEVDGRAVKPTDSLTKDEAERVLRVDLRRRWLTIESMLPGATQAQMAGWVSLAFNAGLSAVVHSKAISYWQHGYRDMCWEEFGGERGFVKSDGIPLDGLKARRREEWFLMTGEVR